MAASGGMFRSLRVRNYRLFASGQVVSLTGTWMQRVAQDWLVLELSGSGTALGIVTALQFGPSLLFSLWGGVLADRYDKRRLLMLTQGTMAALAAVLGGLDVTGAVALWHVYLLAALLGIASAVDVPVRQSFVVEMVGGEDLPNAVSLNSATFNSARIIGPAVAGLVITAVGTGWVFLVNALLTMAVIVGLALMRPGELYRSAPAGRSPGQLREGLRYVRSRPDLVLPMLLVFVIGTFGLNFQLTMALMARVVFGRGATAYGLLSTAIAVGSLAGALASTRRTDRPRQRTLLASAFGFGLLEVRGRVMALYLMCFMGGTPLGAPVIGALSDAFGPRAGVYGGGAVCAVAAAVLGGLFARRRGLRLREQVVHALPHPRVPRRPARAYQRGRRSRHAAGSSSRSTSSVSESSR